MNGMVESALYKLVRQQQESIRQYTRQETQDSDYLLYDFQKDRVITQVDFNQFLAKIIKEHGILTANGRKAVVTSHALRHVCIGERLRSGIYSPEHNIKWKSEIRLFISKFRPENIRACPKRRALILYCQLFKCFSM